MVGGYPSGQHAEIQTAATTLQEKEAVATLPMPLTDPVYGARGPLLTLWHFPHNRSGAFLNTVPPGKLALNERSVRSRHLYPGKTTVPRYLLTRALNLRSSL